MKNGVKNGKNTQFSTENQPSGELKSNGWKRKRYAQEFMDRVMEYHDMTIAEFERIEKEVKDKMSKSKYTIRDLIAVNYVSKSLNKDKFLIDWVDRHVSKANYDKEEEREKEPISKVEIEIFESEYNLEELKTLNASN